MVLKGLLGNFSEVRDNKVLWKLWHTRKSVVTFILFGYEHGWIRASQVGQWVKNPPAMQEMWVWSLGWEDPLEEEMATHSSIFAMDRGD